MSEALFWRHWLQSWNRFLRLLWLFIWPIFFSARFNFFSVRLQIFSASNLNFSVKSRLCMQFSDFFCEKSCSRAIFWFFSAKSYFACNFWIFFLRKPEVPRFLLWLSHRVTVLIPALCRGMPTLILWSFAESGRGSIFN